MNFEKSASCEMKHTLWIRPEVVSGIDAHTLQLTFTAPRRFTWIKCQHCNIEMDESNRNQAE